MNCKRVQRLLLSGADDSLPAATRNALRAHLAACPDCRRERDWIARLDQAVVQWVDAAPLAPSAATRQRLAAPHTRRRAQLRRVVAAGGRAARTAALRSAMLALLLLTLLGLGASLGMPQARTLVQAGLRPFGGGEATLPVLPIAGDRVWIEAISPNSDQALEPGPTFQVQLGYTLVAAPEALLSVRIVGVTEAKTRYFAPPTRVRAGTNRTVVQFQVDDVRARQLLETGEIEIEVLMRAALESGEAPLLARITYGRWELPPSPPTAP
jgi:anti-sigma factor RsiW